MMPVKTMLIQLRWEDPDTGDIHEPLLKAPIVIGREAHQMPEEWAGSPVSKLELPHRQVSRFHALIMLTNRQLYITDKSANGTYLNGRLIQQEAQPFSSKDTLRIGPYKITATLVQDDLSNSTELNPDRSQVFQPQSGGSQNAIFIWLAGVAILLLMGLGTWGIAQMLLQQSRPRVESESSIRWQQPQESLSPTIQAPDQVAGQHT